MLAALRRLRRDASGAALAEFALTLPVWLMLAFAVLNVGRFYWARAGLLNWLGEASRTATLWPARDDTTIRSSFTSRLFGTAAGEAPSLTITPGTSNGQSYVDLQVSYNPQFYLLFVSVQPVTLNYTRRAFRPSS